MKYRFLSICGHYLTPAFFMKFLFPSAFFLKKICDAIYIGMQRYFLSNSAINLKITHSFVLHKRMWKMGYAADLMIFNEELFAMLIKRIQEFKPIMLLSDVPGTAGFGSRIQADLFT